MELGYVVQGGPLKRAIKWSHSDDARVHHLGRPYGQCAGATR